MTVFATERPWQPKGGRTPLFPGNRAIYTRPGKAGRRQRFPGQRKNGRAVCLGAASDLLGRAVDIQMGEALSCRQSIDNRPLSALPSPEPNASSG